MPGTGNIFSKIRDNAAVWLTAGFLVLATAGGTYLVSEDVDADDLEFVDVGWWNIRDFSTSSRDDSEMTIIASIVETDVMAVGELNDTLALKALTRKLGPSWNWASTPTKVGRTGYTAEFYGFIWDSDKLDIAGPVHIFADSLDLFDRDPAWATFQAEGGGLDFTIICVHVTWGKTVGPRKAEVMAMKTVWQAVQDVTPNDNDLICMGDFNRNKTCASFDSLLSISGVIRANQETGPTHIKSSTTYDQVFIDTTFTKEWTGEYSTGLFDETLFDNDADANLAASDHRPVWIRLYVPETDDD